jgi:hypothetical protein
LSALNRFDKEEFDEKVQIGERILRECTDNEIRYDTISALCYAYVDKMDFETAKKYAIMAPSYRNCQEIMYSCCIGGEESIRYNQECIRDFINAIYDFVKVMCYTGGLAEEDKIKAYEFILKLFETLYEDGNYGFEEYILSTLYMKLAVCHCNQNNINQALDCLEKIP